MIFLSSCKKKIECDYIYYKTSYNKNNTKVEINLGICENYLKSRYKKNNTGGIGVELYKNDSTWLTKKYVIYQIGDTIKLSSEFKDNVTGMAGNSRVGAVLRGFGFAGSIIGAIFDATVLGKEEPRHPHFRLAEDLPVHQNTTGCPTATCEVKGQLEKVYKE
ncbi:MAG: hypothetical protein ACK5MD_10220 [Flavobacteriales bacterium]